MCFSSDARGGGLAQLGERLHGMQEVTGSSPVFSTIFPTFIHICGLFLVSCQPIYWKSLISFDHSFDKFHMEKIRELAALLQVGLEEYDQQLRRLQQERLKYIRLSIADGFGKTDGDSKASWLLHLQQLEESLDVRLASMKKAIRSAAQKLDGSPDIK